MISLAAVFSKYRELTQVSVTAQLPSLLKGGSDNITAVQLICPIKWLTVFCS